MRNSPIRQQRKGTGERRGRARASACHWQGPPCAPWPPSAAQFCLSPRALEQVLHRIRDSGLKGGKDCCWCFGWLLLKPFVPRIFLSSAVWSAAGERSVPNKMWYGEHAQEVLLHGPGRLQVLLRLRELILGSERLCESDAEVVVLDVLLPLQCLVVPQGLWKRHAGPKQKNTYSAEGREHTSF